ncbi:MAG: cytochrome C [Phycisphaerales bacterium]|nr:cytochrome C [Phycisphaerales bacterium]
MAAALQAIFGPRIPSEELATHRWRYLTPAFLLTLARVLLLVSIFVPYWAMELRAPQYPDGLHVQAYINRLTGDVTEIDGLNHYIGMRPLNDAAKLERTVSITMLIALVLLVEGAIYVHSKWTVLLTLPSILFPPVFLLDLYFWLNQFGQHLDPKAPLSNAIKPFTPPVLGTGTIGQFHTHASAGLGWWLAAAASVLTIAGLVFHRRAFKPLYDAASAARPGPVVPAEE